jgi:hypothetical protein
MSSYKDMIGHYKKKILDIEDANNILLFINYFKLPMTAKLKKAANAFKKKNTLRNQKTLILSLSEWMVNTTHPIMQDALWAEPRETCKHILENSVK